MDKDEYEDQLFYYLVGHPRPGEDMDIYMEKHKAEFREYYIWFNTFLRVKITRVNAARVWDYQATPFVRRLVEAMGLKLRPLPSPETGFDVTVK